MNQNVLCHLSGFEIDNFVFFKITVLSRSITFVDLLILAVLLFLCFVKVNIF